MSPPPQDARQLRTRPEEGPALSQAQLNIEDRVRTNLFPWRGQFSPQLVEAHLRKYADESSVILDPFAGSGTVLVEAARLGIRAIGTELNPAAATMARAYRFCNVLESEREGVLGEVDRLLADRGLQDDLPLFAKHRIADADLQSVLPNLRHEANSEAALWLLEALVVGLDFHGKGLDARQVALGWQRIRRMVKALPYTRKEVQLTLCDARSTPFKDNTASFVFTSPPYINVFNYHQQYRKSVESLGWNVLSLARSEIGSNRKHRGNRFLTVIQYCLDMTEMLAEMGRVSRPGSRAVFVVGRESNVRKTPFYNGQILRQLAEHCHGYPLLLAQERVFVNRFGQRIYEDILHFRLAKTRRGADAIGRARKVAERALRDAVEHAPSDSLPDLRAALDNLDSVQPSPSPDLSEASKDWLSAAPANLTRRGGGVS